MSRYTYGDVGYEAVEGSGTGSLGVLREGSISAWLRTSREKEKREEALYCSPAGKGGWGE